MVNEATAVAEVGSAGMPAASSKADAEQAATDTSATATAAAICATPNCGKPATLACPTCLSLHLTPTRFCAQSCFTQSWKAHNAAVHKPAKERLAFQPPAFDYTGPLRPHYVTPRNPIPAHIPRPDYAETGIPLSEVKMRGNHTIHIHSAKEIAAARAVNALGRLILDYAHSLVRPGVTTDSIDRAVHAKTLEHNAYPSTMNYNGFPKSLCTSVNECICHGIPDTRELQLGDIVNLDISVYLNGFHGDLNETVVVGETDAESRRLIKCSHDAMMAAIAQVKPGAYCRDFGDIISKHCQREGFSVVRTYCGHGVGRLFHGAPNIPHYARNKAVGQLKPGMIFTIEPMVNAGSWRDVTWSDDWTSTTTDGKRSAQFEHTVLVTETGVEILTARTADSPPLWWEKEGKGEQAKSVAGAKEQ